MDENKKNNEELTEKDKELQEIEDGIVPGLSDADLANEVRSSFLDYAMSVIVSRAIPDVRDGCKPVHRRVIYGMYESGTTPDQKHRKCARIVGDVMGKYHPHGDAAIYSTLVRMAQPFSMRYCLVDGQGNFGSVDGDSPAAMRYTEARMTRLAMEMVRDIKCDTVDFTDNYDGTEREPIVLPSRFPNLLVNGSNGIAVGMATSIPPHNLSETIDAVIALAHNPDITPLELMQKYIFGPDFPTGAIILGREGIKNAFETGMGNISIRSRAEIHENEHTGKKQIIVTEIPYQVNKATMIENIAHLVHDKVIDGITDIRDESSNKGIRVVIDVRRDAIPEVILNQLYKNTQLQTSIGIIMLCLVDGAPKILPINEFLKYYLEYQIEIIRRRTVFLKSKDEARHHIVLGLLNAIKNIDEIVDIIKASDTPEDASQNLKERFGFTDDQTEAILAMTLRRLTGLEEGKLENEKVELEANIEKYNHILSSRDTLIEVVVEELLEIKRKFGDERRTEISDSGSEINDESLIPVEQVAITLTNNNYIKRTPIDTFRTQNRGGRGVKGMSTYSEDEVALMINTNTHTDILFFTSLGKVYRLRGYMVPEGSRIAKGVPIQQLIDIQKGEKVMAMINLDTYDDNSYLFFITRQGLVKKTAIEEFASIRKNGKIAISLKEDDQLLDVKHTDGNCLICLASSKGKLVKFNESDVRAMGRGAAGVKGMNVDGSYLVDVATSNEGKYILAVTQKGYGKMSPIEDYRLTKRGSKGVITLNATAKNGKLVALKAVNGDEDLMIITSAGVMIRIPLEQVKIAGRNTQGVKVIRVDDKQRVSSVSVVEHEDNIEENSENSSEENPANSEENTAKTE